MPAFVIVGCQWGDEGKGKIVDVLAEDAHVVARYQGGSNAGHTVIIGDKKFVLHTLPSGVLRSGIRNLIGNGVVVDVGGLVEEIDKLASQGIDVPDRLLVSEQAHVILPYHRSLDRARESGKTGKIGTTLRGIGAAYADKARRCGIRTCDFRHKDLLVKKFHEIADDYEKLLDKVYGVAPPSRDEELEKLLQSAERIRPMLCDGVTFLNQELRAGKKVICEGAQGVMLDIDHGTYPYVTSSSPTPGGACVGLGIPPSSIKRVIGVVKAYTTRVGEGPLPTELPADQSANLRGKGGEFGATTGRPRRTGWLDLPVLRRALQITGCHDLVITKLDVLDTYDVIPVCTSYETSEGRSDVLPFDLEATKSITPTYTELAGWMEATAGVCTPEELPKAAMDYLGFIESQTGARIIMVSTGPARAAMVHLSETWL